jgi:hypothetical protein
MPQEPSSRGEDTDRVTNRIVVPDTSLGDGVAAGVQALVGLVPGVGATMSAIVDYQWRKFTSEKQTEFNNAVADGLERLHIRADDLTAEFYATLSHVDWLVTMTNEPEKVEAFRNIMLNTALPNPPAAEMRELFLSTVAALTGRHIRLLDFLFHPRKYGVDAYDFQDLHVVNPSIGGVLTLIAKNVPGLDRPDILERCINDLVNQSLVTYQEEGRDARMLVAPRPTDLAIELVAFITAPKALSQADLPEK